MRAGPAGFVLLSNDQAKGLWGQPGATDFIGAEDGARLR